MLRPLLASSILAAAASAQAVYTPIIFEGDPIPGWDDQTVGWNGNNPFLFHVMSPAGDVLFRTQHNESNSGHHLLRFAAPDGQTLVDTASGSPILDSAGAEFRGSIRLDTPTDGSSVFAATVRYDDGSGGSALLHRHKGILRMIAGNQEPVPVHGVAFQGFNSNPFYEADANAAGEAVIKARFELGGADHDGVYRAAPNEPLSRMLDSTQPVPGHPDREWSRATNWLAPFEVRDVPITPRGDAYFRAWFTGDGEPEMFLFRSRRDGSLETLVDSAARAPVPGRDDRSPMLGIVQLAHGGGDAVLLTASTRGSGYTGSNSGGTDVLLSFPEGPMRSIWSSADATIPGRPDLRVEFYGGQEGAAINARSQAVVSSFVHHDDGDFGRVLVSVDPDTSARLIADGNDLPGQHADAVARAFRFVDIDEQGDVAFFANIADQYGGGAVFHWSRRADELTRVLQAGMEINSRTVLEFSLTGSSSSQAAGDRMLSENGAISAAVLLAGDAFQKEQWALVHIQIPAPGSLTCAAAAFMCIASRRRR